MTQGSNDKYVPSEEEVQKFIDYLIYSNHDGLGGETLLYQETIEWCDFAQMLNEGD